MAHLRAFEIHTFQGGKWKIDSVFDDRELAMLEAGRMDESGRYAGVRVIEEDFDELTQKTKIRTIFRGSKVEQSNAAALEKNREERQETQQHKAYVAHTVERRQAEAAAAARARKSNPYRMIGMFTAIALFGIGAAIALRYLYSMV
jgi:hypothetical protein